MDIEIWKDIIGYEGIYEISNLGRVKSLSRIINVSSFKRQLKTRIMKSAINIHGYPYVILYKEKTPKIVTIHKLVAINFITNPLNLPQINHIDGIKLHSYESNLEWCTRSENMVHAFKMGLKIASGTGNFGSKSPRSKSVSQFLNNVLIRTYDGVRDAERLTGISQSCISRSASGKRISAGGFIWTY